MNKKGGADKGWGVNQQGATTSSLNIEFQIPNCRNPSLGLATKARVCKVASQERKPRSERKCEGMNPHTPKRASTLGIKVLVDF